MASHVLGLGQSILPIQRLRKERRDARAVPTFAHAVENVECLAQFPLRLVIVPREKLDLGDRELQGYPHVPADADVIEDLARPGYVPSSLVEVAEPRLENGDTSQRIRFDQSVPTPEIDDLAATDDRV